MQIGMDDVEYAAHAFLFLKHARQDLEVRRSCSVCVVDVSWDLRSITLFELRFFLFDLLIRDFHGTGFRFRLVRGRM